MDKINGYLADFLALGRRKRDGTDDEVQIILTKKKGTDTFERRFAASDTGAAIMALGILAMDLANVLGIPVVHVISVLTLMLTDTGEQNG